MYFLNFFHFVSLQRNHVMMETFVDMAKIMAVFNIFLAIFYILDGKPVYVLYVPAYIYCTLVVNNMSDKYKEEDRSFNRFDRQAPLNIVHVVHSPTNDPTTSGLAKIVNGIRPSELPPRYEVFTRAGMNTY